MNYFESQKVFNSCVPFNHGAVKSLGLNKAILINTKGNSQVYQSSDSALYFGVYQGQVVTEYYLTVREAGHALRMYTEGEY